MLFGFATTSFHLFGITPLIFTPSLIRNLETTFAHPTRRKKYSFTHLDKRCRFGHPFVEISEKYFLPFTYLQWEQCFGHPNRQKNIYPSTNSHWECPNAHPFWEKIFNPLTYLQWERVFFKSVLKISSHLFPQSDRKLSGVFEKFSH